MRKILVFTNISLDGYFAGPDGDLSSFSHDFEAFPSDPGQQSGALLFGRKTYEMMKFWATPQAKEMMPEIAHFMTETPKFVASHTAFEPGWENAAVLSGDVAMAVRRLKEQPGGDIMIFGSNELVVSLLRADLIDELQLVVNPVTLGAGGTLFQGLDEKMEFRLVDTRTFKSGAVMLRLEPVR
jgi:dihydrofolate reductase